VISVPGTCLVKRKPESAPLPASISSNRQPIDCGKNRRAYAHSKAPFHASPSESHRAVAIGEAPIVQGLRRRYRLRRRKHLARAVKAWAGGVVRLPEQRSDLRSAAVRAKTAPSGSRLGSGSRDIPLAERTEARRISNCGEPAVSIWQLANSDPRGNAKFLWTELRINRLHEQNSRSRRSLRCACFGWEDKLCKEHLCPR